MDVPFTRIKFKSKDMYLPKQCSEVGPPAVQSAQDPSVQLEEELAVILKVKLRLGKS